MTDSGYGAKHRSLVGVIAWRASALLFALSWAILPGFGLIDLAVTWGDPPGFTPLAGLAAGWGLLTTCMVAVPFALIALTRLHPAPMVALLFLVGLVLLLASVAALDWRPAVLALAIWTQLALLSLRWRGRPSSQWRRSFAVDYPLVMAAILGVPAWTTYAGIAAVNAILNAPGDTTIGISHWPVQAAFALAVAGCVAVAAGWPRGRRLFTLVAGIASCWFGVTSIRYPDSVGATSAFWSAMSILWGIAVGILGHLAASPEPTTQIESTHV